MITEDRSNIFRFAESELNLLVKLAETNNRPLVEPFISEILALCDKFGKSGQSGGSAPYTAAAISMTVKKLCLFQPISPVTGVEDEWANVTGHDDAPVFQNKRCSALFKDRRDGKSHYLDAITWKTQSGAGFSGVAIIPETGVEVFSRQFVKSFPFEPRTFIVDVLEEEVSPGDWLFKVKDVEQLKAVFEYYDEYKKEE